MSRRKQSTSSKSATIAFSWIKASAVGLAKQAVSRAARAKPPRSATADYASSRAMRLVEPESSVAAAQYATAYLAGPASCEAAGDDGDYGVDGRAAAYIMRVRAKYWSDAASDVAAVAPPPPATVYAATCYTR